MADLKEILEKIDQISKGVKVVAVSKYVGSDAIKALNLEGQTLFGENKVQDLARKSEELKDLNLKWHFIGNLQSNKINQLIKIRPTLWQSCNSLNLAQAVDKRLDYTLDTLLEINIR